MPPHTMNHSRSSITRYFKLQLRIPAIVFVRSVWMSKCKNLFSGKQYQMIRTLNKFSSSNNYSIEVINQTEHKQVN